jgi:hypothetical protein
MVRSNVVLPQPLGPNMQTNSPDRTWKLMSSKAVSISPLLRKLLLNRAQDIWKFSEMTILGQTT